MKYAQWLAAGLIIGLLTGCGLAPGSGGAAGKAGPELRIGMVLMPQQPNLDPQQTSNFNPELICMYDGLTDIEDGGKVVPMLATEWKNLDPLTWEFKLRQGVKFHNGEDFNAAAVKFSFDRIRDPALQSRMIPFFTVIKEIQIVDDYTIRVLTTEPFAPTPAKMQRLWVVPPKLVQQIGPAEFNTKPVGTGPYKFVEWIQGERFTVEANESYWGGAPPVKKLHFLSAPEASTRVAKLLNGEADLIEKVLDADIPRIKADSRFKVMEVEASYVEYVAMNTLQPPFDNPKVRQAMNHAVDVESIIAKVMNGHGKRTTVPNASQNMGYDPSVQAYPYDVNKAKALLTEAGYSGNFPPQELNVGQGNTIFGEVVAEAVAGYLTTAGLPTKAVIMENNARLQKYLSGKATLIMHGSINEQWDSDSHLALNFLSAPKGRGIYYATPKLDELLIQARATFDPEKRKQLYFEAHRVMKDDAPTIPLYTVNDIYAARQGVDWKPPVSRFLQFQRAKVAS